MSAPDHEVIIAGGGPAGCACAAALLRRRPDLAGRVLVLERATHPRSKPCGGGLTGHVPAALAALGLRRDVASEPAAAAEVVFGGVARSVQLQQPVHVVRREELDHSLLQQAAALGAEVQEGAALAGYRVDADGVAVTVRSGRTERTLRAAVLVGADGAGSGVRKALQGHRAVRAPRPLRLFRAELPMPAALRARLSGAAPRMIYDFTPMAEGLRGYVWLFPVPGDRLNVGIMHGAGPRAPDLSGAGLSNLCRRHLARYGVTVPDGALRGWPAWGYDPAARLSGARVCLVGDAAGIDALTGEGIAVGLEQGLVAAEAIDAGLSRGDLSLADYGTRLRRAPVGRELALDRILAWLLYDHAHRGAARHAIGGWGRWLGMVLFDEELLDLYAARVAGTLVLAEHRARLLRVLLRHALRAGTRRAQLRAAIADLSL